MLKRGFISILIAIVMLLSTLAPAAVAEEKVFGLDEYINAEDGVLDDVTVVSVTDTIGGKYINLGGGGRFDDTASITTPQATYKINVAEDGNYVMWYRAWCSNDGSNSFWYRWDSGEWEMCQPSVDVTWVYGQTSVVHLTAGEHTFSIYRREPNAKIDFFYLAKINVIPPVDLTFNPDGSYTVNEYVVVDGNYKDIIQDGFDTGTIENFTARRTSEVGSIEELEQRLGEEVYPGDEILLKDGVYTGKKITISGIEGTETFPVRIAAKNPGGAIFEGNVAVVLKNCKYVEFGGFYFKDVLCNAPGVEAVWVSGTLLTLSGCTNCRVTNNYVENSGNAGSAYSHMFAVCDASAYNRIDHNTFDNPYSMQIGIVASSMGVNSRNRFNRIDHNHFVNVQPVNVLHPTAGGNGMESVQLASGINTAKPNTIVEYNLFENVTGDGNEIISSKSDNNIIQYNTFYDCNSGPTLRFADGNIVRGNYFYKTAMGLRVYGKNHLIEGNYFEDVSRNAIDIRRGKNGDTIYKRSENIIVQNNVIAKTRSRAIGVDLADATADLYARNIEINSNTILAGPMSQPFYEIEENENITYRDNKVLALKNVSTSVYNEGIEYVDSLEELELPEPPERLTNEDAGTTWKKAVNTNTSYVEKRDKIIAFAPGNTNAYNCGEVVEMANAPVLHNSKIYVPADVLAEMLGVDVSQYVSDINGVDMVYINDVKNFDKNVYAVYSNSLVVFTPKDITINATDQPRYPDAVALTDVMLALGGFEVLPTCLDAHMDGMKYGIGDVDITDGGVSVDVLRTVDAPAARLYVALYSDDRLSHIVSAEVSGTESKKFSFDIENADEAGTVKMFVVSGENVLSPLARMKVGK